MPERKNWLWHYTGYGKKKAKLRIFFYTEHVNWYFSRRNAGIYPRPSGRRSKSSGKNIFPSIHFWDTGC